VNANSNDGAIFNLVNVTFSDIAEGSIYNNSLSSMGGGAFYALYSVLTIKGSTFENIGSYDSAGAFLLLSSTASISDTSFTTIYAATYGGVFY
jgi:hypothetical protein